MHAFLVPIDEYPPERPEHHPPYGHLSLVTGARTRRLRRDETTPRRSPCARPCQVPPRPNPNPITRAHARERPGGSNPACVAHLSHTHSVLTHSLTTWGGTHAARQQHTSTAASACVVYYSITS